MELDLLEVQGSPFDAGYRHGEKYAEAIRHFAEERVRLAGGEAWTGCSLERSQVLELAEACIPAHREHTPASIEELEGMAAATGLSLPELIIVNGFTDFVDTVYALGPDLTGQHGAGRATAATADDCTAILIPNGRSASGNALFAQTWDMHASAAEHVLLMRGRLEGAPEFLTFTAAGCVGMIGMNEAGLVVGINNLMTGDGQLGVMWTFAVRELLRRESVDAALEFLQEVPLAGAHNFLLLDRSGKGANVEATPSRTEVTRLEGEPLVHTNHCLNRATREVERPRNPASRQSSEARLERSRDLLASEPVSVKRLQELTADEPVVCVDPVPPLDIATCGAAVMDPVAGEFWAVKGKPSQSPYSRYRVPA